MRSPTSPFTVAALELKDVDRAHALVRLSHPGCSLDAWRVFISAWREAPRLSRGVLAVFSPRKVIVGLAPWWRQPSIDGAALWAGPLFTCEAALQEHVARRLEDALDDLRREEGDAALYLFCAPASSSPAGAQPPPGSLKRRMPPALGVC